MNDKELAKIGEVGEEFGVSTGRQRTANWLNLDKLISSINLSGCTTIVISKVDILDKLGLFKFYYKEKLELFKVFSLHNANSIFHLFALTVFVLGVNLNRFSFECEINFQL